MYINRTLLRVVLIVAACYMAFPVFAQDVEPSPTPRPSTNTILTEVSDAVDRIGIFNFVSAGLIIIAGLGIYVGLKPLIQSGTDANKRADEVTDKMIALTDKLVLYQERAAEREARLDETRRLNAESLSQTVKAQEGLAKYMSQLETKEEAQSRSGKQIESINQHTTEVVNSLKETLEHAVSGIEQVRTDLQQKLTKSDLDDGIKPVIDRLEQVANEITSLRNQLSSTNIKADVIVKTPPSTPSPDDVKSD